MTHVRIIGGHGKIALLAAPLLVQAGFEVSGVIRNPDHSADVAATGATPVVVDIESADDGGWADLLSGVDVLVWSAGAGGGNPARTRAVDHEATVRSIDAAVAAGAAHYVMVSYFGAGPDHGVPEDNSFFAYAQAKTAADEHLRASTGLPWTILQPSRLTEEPGTGRIEVAGTGDSSVEPGEVTRADVAAVIAAVVAKVGDASIDGATLRFNNGDTPIEDAVAALAHP